MRRSIQLGLLIGIIAGIIDVIPMIIQNLTWDANLSAFSMWIVIGFFLGATNIGVKGVVKGLIISYISIVPTLIIIGRKEPFSLIPILIMTTILGALSGYFFEKFNKPQK